MIFQDLVIKVLFHHYAMEIVEKKVIESDRALDMVERAVQMVCAYLPDSIADRSVGDCLKYATY